MQLFPRLALLAISIALLATLLAAPVATGRAPAPRAHAASSFLTGIGDENAKMFVNQNWLRLHTKIVRYIAPYDAAVHRDSLDQAIGFIQNAEATHQQVLVAFYHSEHTPTRLPSVSDYQRDVKKFVKLFPKIKQYQSWNEANRGNVPRAFSSPSAGAAARYYQALIRVCTTCTVLGLDVLDAANIRPTLNYIAAFKHEIGHLKTVMPRIWGLHNYSDINRMESWRTREIARALGGQVWLTETGGLVQFGSSFPNRRGSGLTRAAKVLAYMFKVAAAQSSRVKRLYIYNWTGGPPSTRFDAGLTNPHEQPRAGYVVVCRQLHAAKCGAARLSKT
ncbi:MAG: hypothetical protein QOI03_370 [Solirubrobacteraceae bacterium]|nr:hypothetical protein [Solirubrobacteraceae bacterium]